MHLAEYVEKYFIVTYMHILCGQQGIAYMWIYSKEAAMNFKNYA